MRSATEEILQHSRESGKTYLFDEDHNHEKPVDLWFQDSHEGLVLFVVLFSQACRWSRCLGCNLPSKASKNHVSYRSLVAQIDSVFSRPDVVTAREKIRKLILSNNGSVLDEVTFSSTALMYLLCQLNLHVPNLSVLSVETRPEYVDFSELEFLSRALKEGDTPTALEIAIGFEAFDEEIRNRVFRKGLALETFEGLVQKIASHKFLLKCYFMQKPVPEMNDQEGIEDIRKAIDYLRSLAVRYDIRINMHINPTFVAAGTLLEQAFLSGRYMPPRLQDVAQAARHARGKPLSIFIGLNDEGLAVEGGTFLRKGEEGLRRNLERFNRTQDFDLLDEICGS